MDSEIRRGAVFAVAAFAFWGFTPLYYKLLGAVAPMDILAHRIVWTVMMGVLILWARRDWQRLVALARCRGTMLILLASSLLISLNWFVYIYAVTSDRLLDASLGYYINPLVNVLLGVTFLQERMSAARALSVVLAALGTLNLAIGLGSMPWIALSLGFSFGFYGLLRKRLDVPVVGALVIETGLLLLPAMAVLGWLHRTGGGAFLELGWDVSLLLIAGGPVTMLPLVWFTKAARRLPLNVVGLFQYLGPTITFLLAVIVFEEPFTKTHAVTFSLIWSGLLISTVDSLTRARRIERDEGIGRAADDRSGAG
ncbi:MAG: EamA family transporter RarD [Gammaproteobacteria bacterium]|nr:MAG: EamA family transporter RarD [Gammaproteobacteria bacterium]